MEKNKLHKKIQKLNTFYGILLTKINETQLQQQLFVFFLITKYKIHKEVRLFFSVEIISIHHWRSSEIRSVNIKHKLIVKR